MSSQSTNHAWDLSLYELHRKPHEMVSDSTAIAVSPRALHSELMCPICLDLMTSTLTTKECLHRFCQECIITALRSGNKECPTCRKKLISKRSLRPDPNFDALIAKIYPNREELNAQQERSLALSRQVTVPRNRKRKAAESAPGEPETQQPEEKKPRIGMEPEQREKVEGVVGEEVELQLRPHPEDARVVDHTIRNLTITPLATVAHLVKYLSIYPLLEREKEARGSAVRALSFDRGHEHRSNEKKYTFYIQLEEEYTALPNSTTLQQICENVSRHSVGSLEYWTPGDKLKIYFAEDEHLASPIS